MSRSKNRKIADLISGGTLDDGVIAASEVTGLHSVAVSGNFNELSNKPTPFDPATLSTVASSGSFNDLSDQPTPFDPSTLATVATTGAYSALSGTPALGTASTQAAGAFATAAQGSLADSAVQPNTSPTFGTISASSLTGVGSIDSTTATAIENAGVGVPASKSWTNLGTLNLGSPSNGNWATGFVTLDSSYQNGFEGEILWYLTASRVNQSTNADTQKAYGYSGYQAGDVSTSYLHKTDLKLHYNWSTGGVRYLDNLKALMSRKVRLVESQAGYDALPTGVFPSMSSSSALGNTSDMSGTAFSTNSSDNNNSNGFSATSINSPDTYVPQNDATWDRRIYFSMDTGQLIWTDLYVTLYLNAA